MLQQFPDIGYRYHRLGVIIVGARNDNDGGAPFDLRIIASSISAGISAAAPVSMRPQAAEPPHCLLQADTALDIEQLAINSRQASTSRHDIWARR